MNDKPLERSGDVVLRGTIAALHRAAQRARELARRTGTRLVVSRGGTVHYIDVPASRVADAGAPDGNDA